MKIAVLSHDNGEFDSYVGYFDSPERLEAAVRRLNAERMDTEAMELCAAEVRFEEVRHVPEVVDDDFLDLLASLLEDAGVYVESAAQMRERLAEEAAENDEDEDDPKPVVVAPGQISMEEM